MKSLGLLIAFVIENSLVSMTGYGSRCLNILG